MGQFEIPSLQNREESKEDPEFGQVEVDHGPQVHDGEDPDVSAREGPVSAQV